MLRKVDIRTTLISGLIAAILFCIPVLIYIQMAQYTESWLVYIGSFLFFIVIWIHTMLDYRKRDSNDSTVAMIFASHMATLAGVLFSVVLSFIILTIMVPGYLGTGDADKVLEGVPANNVIDKTAGLSSQVYLAATIINFSVGSFAGIVLPFYQKRNQTKDSRDPAPLHQRGVK